jgi:hypothetical protein
MELLTPLVNLGFRWRRMLSGAFIASSSIHTTRQKTAKPLVSGMTDENGNV